MEKIMAVNHARTWQQSYPSYQPQQPEKKQVIVRKQSWITKGEKILYSFIGISLIIAGIFIVSYSSSTDSLNRELQKLEKSVQTQEVKNEGLIFEVKELSRPERITKIAKDNGLTIQDAKVKQANAFGN